MATEFKLPDLGENIESADVVSVLVSEGDTIDAETNILEVETDKALVEVPCPHAGTVSKIHVAEGDSIEIGQVLITIDEAGGGSAPAEEPKEEAKEEPKQEEPKAEAKAEEPKEQAPAPKEEPKAAPAAESKPAPAKKAAPPAEAKSTSAPAPAGPATRRLARELGVDLHQVKGTGPGGRIERDDVLSAVRNTMTSTGGAGVNVPTEQEATVNLVTPPGEPGSDKYGPIHTEKISKIRKVIAEKMHESKSTAPHVTNFDDAEVTELEQLRKDSKPFYEDLDFKLTSMPFIIKACAKALKLHPSINATFDLDNDVIVYKQYVNIGIAIDTERGLVVPNIRSADRKSIPALAQELGEMATKVRGGHFDVEDLRGGSFTISNLGAIGGTYSTPIINYPEVAIILIGRSRWMPVVVDGEIKPRFMCPLSLSYDHRLVDGGAAARFLNDVKSMLENPTRLLLAP